jgi:hypothetical protein
MVSYTFAPHLAKKGRRGPVGWSTRTNQHLTEKNKYGSNCLFCVLLLTCGILLLPRGRNDGDSGGELGLTLMVDLSSMRGNPCGWSEFGVKKASDWISAMTYMGDLP